MRRNDERDEGKHQPEYSGEDRLHGSPPLRSVKLRKKIDAKCHHGKRYLHPEGNRHDFHQEKHAGKRIETRFPYGKENDHGNKERPRNKPCKESGSKPAVLDSPFFFQGVVQGCQHIIDWNRDESKEEQY